MQSSSSSKAPRWFRTPLGRITSVLGGVVLLCLLFSVIDLSPDLDHLDVRMLAGPAEGNYAAIAEKLSQRAAEHEGKLLALPSRGTVENLERLASEAEQCTAHYALVQDGVAPAEGSDLELIGRLPKSESLFFLGRDAARLERFSQLRGKKIGVGPEKSGTDRVAREILASGDFRSLGLKLSNHGLTEQLEQLVSGELDLGAFVIDEDAELVRDALRSKGLELTSFRHLDVVARLHPFLWHGRIGAGQYDPIELVPPQDHRVLRVDTLVVGNGCSTHSETIALLSLLSKEFPRFIEVNKSRGGSEAFPRSSSAQSFFENNGPEFAEVHVPWLVDLMPPSNWVYIVMTISVLFNLMGLGHRFQLWRVDSARLTVEQQTLATIGEGLTYEEIQLLEPSEKHLDPGFGKRIDELIASLEALRARCRKLSVSPVVPMGQEMAYRFQEERIEEALAAVRSFREKLTSEPT